MKIVCVIAPIYDYSTATLIEGLLELGHQVLASESSNYATRTPDRALRRQAENADLIVVGSNRRVRTWLVEDVDNPRKVFLDGTDSQEFRVHPHIAVKLVFKRELNRLRPAASDEFVFPLPFAAEKRYFRPPLERRDIRVSFAARLKSNILRYSIQQRLLNRNDPSIFCGSTGERAYSSVKGQGLPLETPQYREILYRSQIAVNVAGAGYDCARYWEILAAGAALLTQEIDIVIPHPFSDGLNCFVFDSLRAFETRLDELLGAPARVAEVAAAGHAHLLAHHRTRQRAEFFLATVNRHIDRDGICAPFYLGPRSPTLLEKLRKRWST